MSQQRSTRGLSKLLKVPDRPIGHPGYHDPMARLGGPVERSALTARMILAMIGFGLCVLAAVLCVVFGAPVPPIAILAFAALAFLVDFVIVLRRKLSGEPG